MTAHPLHACPGPGGPTVQGRGSHCLKLECQRGGKLGACICIVSRPQGPREWPQGSFVPHAVCRTPDLECYYGAHSGGSLLGGFFTGKVTEATCPEAHELSLESRRVRPDRPWCSQQQPPRRPSRPTMGAGRPEASGEVVSKGSTATCLDAPSMLPLNTP